MESAVYVYCVVKTARKPATARMPPGLPGAARAGVYALEPGVWLVAADVPLSLYGSSALESSLRDIEWVSGIALAHEAVVEHFAEGRGATVIPMKLFTMFSTVERAAAEMRRRRRELARVFLRVEGCEEWGVRVTRDGRRPSAPASPPTRPSSGAAFLAARKQARDQSRLALHAAAEAADAAFASLSEIARDGRRRADDVPADARPLLDAAFLVPARSRRKFHAAAERVAKDVARSGAHLTLTGPWPPYNFVGAGEAR